MLSKLDDLQKTEEHFASELEFVVKGFEDSQQIIKDLNALLAEKEEQHVKLLGEVHSVSFLCRN